MAKHIVFIIGSGVMGVLMAEITDYNFLKDWEPWVLCLPYWVVGPTLLSWPTHS